MRTAETTAAESDASIEERLHQIQCSLARYGCFDLVEEDVEWLIERLRVELDRRLQDH